MAGALGRRTIVEVVGGSGTVADELSRLLDLTVVEVRGEAEVDAGPAPPDVVVADLDHLALLGAGPRSVPVLALVRRDRPDEVRRAISSGASDVLPVPLVEEEVRARVAGLARVSTAEARLRARNAELLAWAERGAHDLMTPLAVIGGMAETLEAAWDRLSEPDRGRLLGSIRNQVAKATRMLDEAFALARQAPEASPGPEPGSP
jgi:signal transduction histidine kinase